MIYQIAIDGTVASGKGTVARMLARKLGVLCLDTGAIYRGITVYMMDNRVDLGDSGGVLGALGKIKLDIRCVEGETLVVLNGKNITKRIRENAVSEVVPNVAKIPAVREHARVIQQEIGENASLVCEGRDITSVVFPNAMFKFYLTAGLRVRAKRRQEDLRQKGEIVPLHEIEKQIAERDHADMTRAHSPLVCVPDAIKIDATRLTAHEVAKKMEGIVTKKLRVANDKRRVMNYEL